MIIETYLIDILIGTKNNDENDKDKNHWIQLLSLGILKIIIIIIAIYLAWDCSSKNNIIFRLLSTIFAGLFSGFYILYYSIYRTFLGNKCYV